MVVLVAEYICFEGKGDEVQELLQEMKQLVEQKEKGCKLFTVNRSEEDKDFFLLYEQYVDQASLEAHRETTHFKEIIIGKVIPLLAKRKPSYYSLV